MGIGETLDDEEQASVQEVYAIAVLLQREPICLYTIQLQKAKWYR